MITNIISRIKEIDASVKDCECEVMPFEQAYSIARFYYDYQDTNAIIDEAEAMATEDAVRLRELAAKFQDETALYSSQA